MMHKNGKKGVLALVLFLILIFMFAAAYASQPICSCKPLTYKFSLKNIEDFSETYELSVDRFGNYVSFDQDKVMLGGGKSKPVFVSINLPCNVTGEHTIGITAKGDRSKGIKEIPIELNLVSCYNYGVEPGKDFLITGEKRKITFTAYGGNYSICKGDKKAIPILITNKGVDNEYSFNVEGVDWARLSGNNIKLVKNQQGVVYLSLLPSEEVEGKFQLEFDVVNKFGNKERSIPINVDVEECYGVDITLLEEEDTLCGCESKNYEMIVSNIGKYNDSFDFIIEPYWANLDLEESISLDASENVSVDLSVEPPCKKLKPTTVEVTGFLRSRPEIKDSGSLRLNFLQKDECYKARIIAGGYVKIDYDTTSVPFTVKNEGGKETTYFINIEAPDWISPEIESITLKPGDAVELNLIIESNNTIAEDDYAVIINLDSEDYKQSKVVVLRLRKDVLLKEIMGFVGNYSSYLLAGVLLAAASIVFLFVRKKMPKGKASRKRRKRKWILYTIFILVLLAAIAAIIYLLNRFSLFDKIGWFLFWYQYYVYTLVLLIIILVLIILFFIKRKKKKQIKTEIKKGIKVKIKKALGFIYISIILIVILGIIIYSFIEYNLFVREFIVTYLYYIIIGVVLLVIFILILKFNKWVTELFLGEKKNKKR